MTNSADDFKKALAAKVESIKTAKVAAEQSTPAALLQKTVVKSGRDGSDGKHGVGIKQVLANNGSLFIEKTDGSYDEIPLNLEKFAKSELEALYAKFPAKDGENGRDGKNGSPGVGVRDIFIDKDGLVFDKTDGNQDIVPVDFLAISKAAVQDVISSGVMYDKPITEWRGVWQGAQEYKRGALVTYVNALYVAIADSKDVPPGDFGLYTDTNVENYKYWQIMFTFNVPPTGDAGEDPGSTVNTGATPPTSAQPGSLWVNSTSGSLYYYNGNSWVSISGGGGGSGGSSGSTILTGDGTNVPAVNVSKAGDLYINIKEPERPRYQMFNGAAWVKEHRTVVGNGSDFPTKDNSIKGDVYVDVNVPGAPKVFVFDGNEYAQTNNRITVNTTGILPGALPNDPAPQDGDLYLFEDHTLGTAHFYLYEEDTKSWHRATRFTAHSSVAPTLPEPLSGDRWLNNTLPDNQVEFMYNGTTWIRLTRFTTSSVTPPTVPVPVSGDKWIDTSITGIISESIYQGGVWVRMTRFTRVSATQPTGPAPLLDGDRWIDISQNGYTSLWSYVRGNWVRESRYTVTSATAPTVPAPLNGDTWLDTSNPLTLSEWNYANGTWVRISRYEINAPAAPTNPPPLTGDVWIDTSDPAQSIRHVYQNNIWLRQTRKVTLTQTMVRPVAPIVGDLHIVGDGPDTAVYECIGQANPQAVPPLADNWLRTNRIVYQQDTAPTANSVPALEEGDMWIRSIDNRMMIRTANGWIMPIGSHTTVYNGVATDVTDTQKAASLAAKMTALGAISADGDALWDYSDPTAPTLYIWNGLLNSWGATGRTLYGALRAPLIQYHQADVNGVLTYNFNSRGSKSAWANVPATFSGCIIGSELDPNDPNTYYFIDGKVVTTFTAQSSGVTNPQYTRLLKGTGTYTLNPLHTVVMTFTQSTSFTLPTGAINIRYTVVGGGGGANGGVSGSFNPVSGGGGQVVDAALSASELSIWQGTLLNIIVGNGGNFGNGDRTAGGTGGASSISGIGITTVFANGGLGPGATTNVAGSSGAGHAGLVGGGGGAGGPASSTNRLLGGPGITSTINGVNYGAGGTYSNTNLPTNAAPNTGIGGHGGIGTGAGDGGSGVVILSYQMGTLALPTYKGEKISSIEGDIRETAQPTNIQKVVVALLREIDSIWIAQNLKLKNSPAPIDPPA